MAGLGTLVVDLLLRTGSFESDMGRASKAANKRMKEIEASATAAGKVLGTALAAGAGIAAYAIKEAIDQADHLNEVSQKVGIPTDVLSGLAYAAKLSGVATEELQNGLVKLAKFQADAARGGQDSTKVFETLGIAVKDSAGNLRDSATVFSDFAEAFSRIPDGPEKSALAVQVFGKAGAELIPLLDEGRAGIRGYADELRDLGGIVTPATAKAADAFNDNLDKLKVSFGGLALNIAGELLPAMTDITTQFVDFAKSTDASEVAAGIGNAFDSVAAAIRRARVELEYLSHFKFSLNLSPLSSALQALHAFQGADAAAAKAEATHQNLVRTGLINGRTGIRGGRGMGADLPKAGNVRGGPDLSRLFSPTPKASKGASVSHHATDALDDLQRQLDAVQAASRSFNSSLEDMQAEIGGPLAKALLDHNRKLAELDDLAKRGEISSDKLREAKAAESELYERDKKAITERLDVGGSLLKDLQFELDLVSKTNAERETAIQLRGMDAESVKKYGAAILAANEELSAAREADAKLRSSMDEFRSSFSDTVTDVLTGTASIGDAFKSLADQVINQIARMIANNLTKSLFGDTGSSGGGSAGGLLSGLFGLFTGGSGSGGGWDGSVSGMYANGTDFAAGGLSLVGERGPELVNLPRGAKVIPNHKLGGLGGNSTHITINVPGNTTRETANQIAAKVGMAMRIAQRDAA